MAKHKSIKPPDYLKRKLQTAWLVPILLVLVGTVWLAFRHNTGSYTTEGTVEYIESYMSSPTKFNDFQGKLDCNGVEDMGWYDKDNQILINVGRVQLSFEKDYFESEHNQMLLQRIGISCTKNSSTGEYKLYWGGEEIPKMYNN